MSNKILDNINSPTDIKSLSEYELNELADEIRTVIIETVSENGGHLASNLGVVELTLAIHKVFNMPVDKLVWDVGHQSYAHKIITGRKNKIHVQQCVGASRTKGGVYKDPCENHGKGHGAEGQESPYHLEKSRGRHRVPNLQIHEEKRYIQKNKDY